MEELIGVVCNDAGGANLVARICKQEKKTYEYFLTGPAIRIFQELLGIKSEVKIEQFMENCTQFLCGTSGLANTEREVIQKAKLMGKKTTAVLDHWINYEARFKVNEELILPDEIWVVDEFAFEMAKKLFHGTQVQQIENLYVSEFVQNYKQFSRDSRVSTLNRVLYLSEGFDEFNSNSLQGRSIDLEYFETFLEVKDFQFIHKPQVFLRLHPSEAEAKFCHYQNLFSNLILADATMPLFKQFAGVDAVIGVSSMGLVLSAACGIRTISLLKGESESKIPIKGIEYLGV